MAAHSTRSPIGATAGVPRGDDSAWAGGGGLAPLLLLAIAIAVIAFALHQIRVLSPFSPLVLAIVLGLAFQNLVGAPPVTRAGIAFSLRWLLRGGIVLLGLQLTLADLLATGPTGLLLVVLTPLASFGFVVVLGRILGVDHKLTGLIAAGTSVCGASAVLAAKAATRASDEHAAYAIACVTLFGTAAMFLYPLLAQALGMGSLIYGMWAGASIHEIAQVIAAAFQMGDAAGHAGVVVKLGRVAMLAPMVLLLALGRGRGRSNEGGARVPLPWFVVGFLAMVVVASLGWVPHAAAAPVALLAQFLLTVALAAMGLGMSITRIAAQGLRPLFLAGTAAIFISGFAWALIAVTG
jgi:uncharacterized integral membrane protein (TIGR00698 family)